MNYTRILFSALAYMVVSTAIAVAWHEALFGDLYRGFNIYSGSENVNIPLAAFGSLIEGTVLTLLFRRFAAAENRLRFGIWLGVMICLFASSYGVFQTAALEKVEGAGTGAFIAAEFAAMMLYGVVGGVLISWLNPPAGMVSQ